MFHQFTGEVKCHNVCKNHGLLDTGFKQIGPCHFLCVIPMGLKKNQTASKCKFEETLPKLSVNSGNNSQGSYNN